MSTHPSAALSKALGDCRRAFGYVALFSAVVNLLMLAGPLYMLQVYDRVLTGRSVPTLVALTIFIIAIYLFQGALELIRSRITVRIAGLVDQHLSGVVFGTVMRLSGRTAKAADANRPLRDLDQIRTFLTGGGPTALLDLPWTPVFFLACWVIHPWLGIGAIVGGAALFAVSLFGERLSRQPLQSVQHTSSVRWALVEAVNRNAEAVNVMGLERALSERWGRAQYQHADGVQRVSDIIGASGSVIRILRVMLQSLLIATGAYLVIRQELLGGGIIAASVLMGRALAPLESIIANWRSMSAARDSLRRMKAILQVASPATQAIKLPGAPKQRLEVDQLVVLPPGGERPTLSGINFTVEAGTGLGIVGPSGAGKTTLVRALVGLWSPARGEVRLDGAALSQWSPQTLGPAIGYMGQSPELFDGTIAENIARMESDPDLEAVVGAARAAGAHDMIVRLRHGYDTEIGEAGAALSAGQRQRVALARALYGMPFLIILDEPNAYLDGEGDFALEAAVRRAKAWGSIVIVVAHRPSGVMACENVVVLADGTQRGFGPREEILRKLLASPARPIGAQAAARGPQLVRTPGA